MADFIVATVLLAIVGLALWYIIRAKKRGAKCIGCPEGCCSAKKDGGTSCCCCGSDSQSNSPSE